MFFSYFLMFETIISGDYCTYDVLRPMTQRIGFNFTPNAKERDSSIVRLQKALIVHKRL